jgi:hypothetical protein
MDLALTFHIGLCLRIPRTDKQKFLGAMWEPLQKCLELVRQADDALHQANNVSAYQTVGVRCREALLAFASAAQASVDING